MQTAVAPGRGDKIEDGRKYGSQALHDDNTGTPVSYTDACSALPDGLNEKTLSLKTDKGESWQVWTDVGYKETESPIFSGTYDFNALLQYDLVHADEERRRRPIAAWPWPGSFRSTP